MTNEHFYKSLFEAAQEETGDVKDAFLSYFDKRAKEDLGDLYYDYKDFIMVQDLKEYISELEDPNFDQYETPDNKAHTLSSMYHVLKHFSIPSDYKKFLKERRDAKTQECD